MNIQEIGCRDPSTLATGVERNANPEQAGCKRCLIHQRYVVYSRARKEDIELIISNYITIKSSLRFSTVMIVRFGTLFVCSLKRRWLS